LRRLNSVYGDSKAARDEKGMDSIAFLNSPRHRYSMQHGHGSNRSRAMRG
jgi:hypothetical protein